MKTCPECGKTHDHKWKKCCSDDCTKARNKRMTNESHKRKEKYYRELMQNKEEEKVIRISHIDDIERYARAKGKRYADLQKMQTLSMIDPIRREI